MSQAKYLNKARTSLLIDLRLL